MKMLAQPGARNCNFVLHDFNCRWAFARAFARNKVQLARHRSNLIQLFIVTFSQSFNNIAKLAIAPKASAPLRLKLTIKFRVTPPKSSVSQPRAQCRRGSPIRTSANFANDPSLSAQEISTLRAWLQSGKSKGNPNEGPPAKHWSGGWNIPQPDAIIKMPVAVNIPANGDVEYTYEIVPTGFTEDKWVQASQILPSGPQFVHHAVVYIRPPDSKWLARSSRRRSVHRKKSQ